MRSSATLCGTAACLLLLGAGLTAQGAGGYGLTGRPKLGEGTLILPGYHVPLPATDGTFVDADRDYMPQDPTTDQQAFYEATSPPTFTGTSATLVHYWPPWIEGASPQIWGGDPHPAFVFVHGGGFFGGAGPDFFKQHEGDTQIGAKFQALQEAGYAIFALDYNLNIYDVDGSLHGSLTKQIRQVKRAIQFLRFNAAFYNIDPDRILVGGTSGGGMIALHAALGTDLMSPEGAGYEIMSSRPNRAFSGFGTQFFEDPAQPGNWAKCPQSKDFAIGPSYGTCIPIDPELPVSNTNPCTLAGVDPALAATQAVLDRIDLMRVVTKHQFDYSALGLEQILIVHSPLFSGVESFPVVNNHSPLFSDYVEVALAANGTVPWVRVPEVHDNCNGPPYIEKSDSALGVQVLCLLGFDGPPGNCPDYPPNCIEYETLSAPCAPDADSH